MIYVVWAKSKKALYSIENPLVKNEKPTMYFKKQIADPDPAQNGGRIQE